jgi:hypothetical protein
MPPPPGTVRYPTVYITRALTHTVMLPLFCPREAKRADMLSRCSLCDIDAPRFERDGVKLETMHEFRRAETFTRPPAHMHAQTYTCIRTHAHVHHPHPTDSNASCYACMDSVIYIRQINPVRFRLLRLSQMVRG